MFLEFLVSQTGFNRILCCNYASNCFILVPVTKLDIPCINWNNR